MQDPFTPHSSTKAGQEEERRATESRLLPGVVPARVGLSFLLGLLLAALPLSAREPLARRVEIGEELLVSGDRKAAFVTFRAVVASYESGDAQTSDDLAAVAAALVHLGQEDPDRFRDALRLYDQAVAADPTNLDAQVALGDLFLAKYNGQDAREAFKKVLGQDPENAGALLGLARVRRFDGETDVFELTAESLEQDPELVPARLFQARLYLDLEDYARADREAEKALEVDPGSAQAYALLAATALLSGDRQEYERRFERLETRAPNDPTVYVTLAEVAARNRLYQSAVRFAGRAVEIDSLSWRGYALRGVNRLRTGEIAAGRQDLETAFAGDPFDVWTKNTLDLLDEMAGYEVVRTERFELVIPAREADLLALYLGPLAEEAYDTLAAHYGVALPTPVRVEVFPRHADFSVRTIGLAGLGALGVSFGPVVAMDAPSARPAGDFHWGTTLWHELAHSFHMGLSGHRVPRWFTEGLAVFEERRAHPGWGDGVNPEFLLAYKQDRLAPVEDLNQGFMRPAYPQQIIFSYYQASLVFDYITERWDFPTVVAMLKGYRDGRNTPEIFTEVLGIELTTFARDFDEYFHDRFARPLAALRLPVEGSERPTPADLRRRADGDPDDFLAHLIVGQSLVPDDPEAARPYLETAKALFPDYVGIESPRWWLGRLHREAGRLDEAVAELRDLVERNKAHYPALRALAEIRAEMSDPEGAARALDSAQYVYPYEQDDHRRLAEWSEAAGNLPMTVRERRAVLALDPVNRSRALYELALAQRAAGDRKAARSTVLEALEQAPNYDDALTLLLELRADSGGSP